MLPHGPGDFSHKVPAVRRSKGYDNMNRPIRWVIPVKTGWKCCLPLVSLFKEVLSLGYFVAKTLWMFLNAVVPSQACTTRV